MRTYPLTDQTGAIFAFEVPNAFLSPRAVSRLVRSNLGAIVTAGPYGFWSTSEIRLRFRYAGTEFEISEPFGDNSRYWVGPAGAKPSRVPAIDQLLDAFNEYRPNLFRRLLSALGW